MMSHSCPVPWLGIKWKQSFPLVSLMVALCAVELAYHPIFYVPGSTFSLDQPSSWPLVTLFDVLLAGNLTGSSCPFPPIAYWFPRQSLTA